VKSAVGEERARTVLRELEDFHQLVGTLVFDRVRLPELPVEVLLIGDADLLRELAPERDGQRREFAGYYQRGQDRDFIVLSNRVYSRSLASIVYHELTHYFLSRALSDRPVWLSEGLAEYFATAEIDGNNIYVGAVSADRIRVLRRSRLIPINEFLLVDQNSPHYNETQKANSFYAQAWAFVHFLQNRRAAELKRSIDALATGPADLFEYVKLSPAALQTEFENYLGWPITLAQGLRVRAERERWSMKIEPIPDTEAEMSIGEIFLAMGRIEEARRHLGSINATDTEFPRAAYYRGVLAQLSNDFDGARDFFVDALVDAQLGPRAAVSLVQIGEMDIPSVRTTLQQAALSNTRMSDVYWALSEIYLQDIRRIKEEVTFASISRVSAPILPASVSDPGPASQEPLFTGYAEVQEQHLRYSLQTNSSRTPGLLTGIAPYYPEELLTGGIGGKVIMDVQLTETGDVGGVWLVSASPDVFAGLATAAVRQWRFEPVLARIRVILDFVPDRF
jgi:hypothetical protein